MQKVVKGHDVGLDTEETHVVEDCPGLEPKGAMGSSLEQAVVDDEIWLDAFALHLCGRGETKVEALVQPGSSCKFDGITVLACKVILDLGDVCAGKGMARRRVGRCTAADGEGAQPGFEHGVGVTL